MINNYIEWDSADRRLSCRPVSSGENKWDTFRRFQSDAAELRICGSRAGAVVSL